MGADIHWIAERLHPDGEWEAVLSKSSYRASGGDRWYTNPAMMSSPIERFGDRDYIWFGILSEVRCDSIDEIGLIAEQGLPEYPSDHTCENLGDDGDLHSHGWFTVSMLSAALEKLKANSDPGHDYDDAIETLEQHLSMIRGIIQHQGSDFDCINSIIFGREYDAETSVRFPDMQNESNHAAIQRKARSAELLPIGPDTFRFCIAYDN